MVKRHIVTGKNDPELPPDTLSTHLLTQVDKIHAEGNIGKGIKIGMYEDFFSVEVRVVTNSHEILCSIDTGIDYNHPALGGGFGSNFLVAGGYDFVGDNYDGTNAPVPDSDPHDNCNGHGTHVAV